jgi:hypothetical protein
MEYPISRSDIIGALQQAFEPLDFTLAFWEAGAAAFDRVDQWSDIDLQLVVNDDRVAQAAACLEQTLASLSPVSTRFEVPQPTWHGHWQAFYQLHDASPYHLVDFCIMKANSPEKFIQPEIHGHARVLFDKANIVHAAPLDKDALAANLQHRLDGLRAGFFMSKSFVEKELLRGHLLDAFAYYHGLTLRPLIEALRIRYKPSHHNFGNRYLYVELPADVVAQLEPLFFVASPEELIEKREQAERLFYETVAATNVSTSIAADPAFVYPSDL